MVKHPSSQYNSPSGQRGNLARRGTSVIENLLETAKHYQPFAPWLSVVISSLSLIVGAFGLMLAINRNQAIKSATSKGIPRKRRYWPWVAIIIVATLVAWGPTILLHYGYLAPMGVQAQSPPSPDLRTVPLAPDSTFLPLAPYFDESVTVWCFPYDPDSCAIALRYRSRLADGFNMRSWHVKDDGGNDYEFLTGMSHLHRTDFKGIKIDTRSEQDRPEGAKELLKNLRALGVPADFAIDNQENLGPKDFEIWIGGKP